MKSILRELKDKYYEEIKRLIIELSRKLAKWIDIIVQSNFESILKMKIG